uniref:SKICH domain-containing protein n=1 Tax=Ditylenchus dipsaci TaxID=166011 RepID=A0A915CR55_9BILA
MVLSKQNEPPVRFFNLKYSYLTTESIVIDLSYSNEFMVADRDWIGILPAGFVKAAHFSALKMAPARKVPKSLDVNKCFPRLGADKCGELHKIVFKAKEARLAPRHFYQLAYIRNRKNQHQILAASCVFYIESVPSAATTLTSSVSMPLDEVMKKKQQQMVVQQEFDNGGACRIFKNLLCGNNSTNSDASSWTTTSFVLPSAPSVGISEDSGVEDAEDGSPSKLLNKSPFDAKVNTPKEVPEDSDSALSLTTSGNYSYRSASMYEIGSSPNAYMAGLGVHDHIGHPSMHNDGHDFQKLICQLTMSNSNLMRENEALARRLQQSESLLRDHVEHLNSVYYTLFRNGYSALQFPDGEEVHLSQFRGVLLNFVPSRSSTAPGIKISNKVNNENLSLSDIASSMKERRQEATSDLSSDSSMSSTSVATDSEELKTAIWLNDGSNTTPRDTNSAFVQQQLKSRSMEDHVQLERLRLGNRTGLQRTSRIDELHPTSSSPSAISARAYSESELRPDRAAPHPDTSPANGQTNGHSSNSGAISPNTGGSMSARSVKSKTARLRAQSLGGSKIFSAAGTSSTRRTSGNNKLQVDKTQPTQRKSLTAMRSPILTCGRSANAPKVGELDLS